MQIIKNEYFTKLLAEEGKVICSIDGVWDSTVHIKEVDLGIDDSPENYFEENEIFILQEDWIEEQVDEQV